MSEHSKGDDDIAAAVVTVLPALNRALDHRAEQEFPQPKPPAGQMAVLRLVEERDGVTVREASELLLMKASNVSALVSQMVTAGLIRRERDVHDKRVAHLHLTDETRARLRDVDALYSGYVREALAGLGPAERAALASAVPALRALARQVHPHMR